MDCCLAPILCHRLGDRILWDGTHLAFRCVKRIPLLWGFSSRQAYLQTRFLGIEMRCCSNKDKRAMLLSQMVVLVEDELDEEETEIL